MPLPVWITTFLRGGGGGAGTAATTLLPLVPSKMLQSHTFLTTGVSKSLLYVESQSKPEFVRFMSSGLYALKSLCLLRNQVSLTDTRNSGSLINVLVLRLRQ